MLYDLFFALFEAFKWIVVGTAIMFGLFLLFVVLPAMLFDARPPARHERKQEKIRFKKELDAQHATFYSGTEDTFFESIQEHIFGEKIEKPFQDPEPIFDSSTDTLLRDEAMRFLAGDINAFVQPPTLFEETVGNVIWNGGEYPGQDQPKLLRDKTTTFLKNTDGDTDGFRKLL